MSVLFTIPNYNQYGPATEYLEAHPELEAAREAKLESFITIGNYVAFGSYEQDNDTDNGKEPIEWLVLDYDETNHRVLLLSRYGLDAKPFNTERVITSWEECTLRTWLNGEFIINAFSKAEQRAILTTAVDNTTIVEGSSTPITRSGNNTEDKVFLLSYAEANRYLGLTKGTRNNIKLRTTPTAYALKQGAFTSDSNKTTDGMKAGWWWLRNSGYNPYYAAVVDDDDYFNFNYVDRDDGCVCPALWIILEFGIF